MSIPPEIAVETRFHARDGTKSIPVFLPAEGEASTALIPDAALNDLFF